jgi:flagellar biosynthetic protein FliP
MPTLARGTALRLTVLVIAALAALGVTATGPAYAVGAVALPAGSTIEVPAPELPTIPAPGDTATQLTDPAEGAGTGQVTLDLKGGDEPSKAIVAILLLTVLSLAPALLLLMTSFTRIVIVLSLTRNALGVQAIPPNQVIVGLALFLSLFIMGPTLAEVNERGIQPLLKGEKDYTQAYEDGIEPLRDFMLKEVKEKELALFVKANGDERPVDREDVSITALIPAFVLSEIKTAFIIGFVIFIPFLVIDIVVSSSLMSMGMMMLPPVLISLPFKLLLFVMVDGWALVVRSLLSSYV